MTKKYASYRDRGYFLKPVCILFMFYTEWAAIPVAEK